MSSAITLTANATPVDRVAKSSESGPEHVVVVQIDSHTECVALCPKQRIDIGRDPSADVFIDDPTLSRRHASLQIREGAAWIQDLRSRNGTFIDGDRVASGALEPGQQARLGKHVFLWVYARPRLPKWQTSHEEFQASFRKYMGEKSPLSMALVDGLARKDLEEVLAGPEGNPILSAAWYAPGVTEVLLRGSKESLGAPLHLLSGGGQRRLNIAEYPADATCGEDLLGILASAHIGRNRPGPEESEEREGSEFVSGRATAKLVAELAKIASSPLSVLIHGETGVGKEVVASEIHRQSARREGPFVALNCGAISETLIESTLFGHERGAFTGAETRQCGVFEQASGGTLFLDEVAELSPRAQVALLRALETRRIRRVGGAKDVSVDIRLVAATHRDLREMIAAGSFREDLFFRIASTELYVPPLRDRRDEIAALAQLFLRAHNRDAACPVERFSRSAMEIMQEHDWPGNIRQLRNVVERAAVLCRSEIITELDLPEELFRLPRALAQALGEANPEGLSFDARMRELEIELLLRALITSRGNRTLAAETLQLPRRTFLHKLKHYGVSPALLDNLDRTGLEPLEKDAGSFKSMVRHQQKRLVEEAIQCCEDATDAAKRLGLTKRRYDLLCKRLGLEE